MHPLNKLPYSKLDSKAIGIKSGVVFVTYSSLIASSERGRSRLQQLVQWCGAQFDGLVVFDEVFYLLMHLLCLFSEGPQVCLNKLFILGLGTASIGQWK